MDTRSKIVTAEEADERIAVWLAAGDQVDRFTGTFDPLLAPDIERLEQSARPGARLVVYMVDPVRPILSRHDRCQLVAALRRVDLVVG